MRHARFFGATVLLGIIAASGSASAAEDPECANTAWRLDPVQSLVRNAIANRAIVPGSSTDARAAGWRDQTLRAVIEDIVFDKLLAEAESARIDKQVGATSSAPGTTTLVSKAAAAVLGFALERGAIAQAESSDGTTITLTTKPLEAIRKLVLQEPYLKSAATKCDSPFVRFVGGFSLSATFLADGKGPPQFNENNLVAFSVRHELVNRRDPRSHARAKELVPLVKLDARNLPVTVFDEVLRNAAADPQIAAWRDNVARKILDLPQVAGGPSPSLLREVEENALESQPRDLSALNPFLLGAVTSLLELQRDAFLNTAARGDVLSLELNFDRRLLGLNALWTARGIYERGVFNGYGALTLNGSVQFFHDPPVLSGDTKRIRQSEGSVQVDTRLGTPAKNAGILSFAGKAGHLAATMENAGNIGVVQVKWTVTKGGAAITPFSLTWASREELNKEASRLSANVGVTFDLNSLFAGNPH